MSAGPAVAAAADNLAEGRLLVADRDLQDPGFSETAILLISYKNSGAIGLVLNRRTDVPISRALTSLKEAEGRSDPVFLGGPVEQDSILALLRSKTKPDGATELVNDVYLLTGKELLQKALASKTDASALHIYVGYAGWGPGQLDAEVDAGAWHVLSGNANTIFDHDPDTLWPRLIGRTEQHVVKFSPDLSGKSFLRGNRRIIRVAGGALP